MRVGYLDTETLALTRKAVITEIAWMVHDTDQFYVTALDGIPNTNPRSLASLNQTRIDIQSLMDRDKANTVVRLFYPSVVEQLALGREVDPKTVKWHQDQHEKKQSKGDPSAKRETLAEVWNRQQSSAASCIDVLYQFVEDLSGIDELWINGLTFDPQILESLAEDLGKSRILWKPKRERDWRTIRDTMFARLSNTRHVEDLEVDELGKHTALGDVSWLAQGVLNYGKVLRFLQEN